MDYLRNILRPVAFSTALIGSTLFGCGNGDSKSSGAQQEVSASKKTLEEIKGRLSGLESPTTATYVPSVPTTVTQPGTTTIPTAPTTVVQPSTPTTVTQPSVPIAPGTTTVPTGPTGPVTPGKPNVPSVTAGSKRKRSPAFLGRALADSVSRNSEKSEFNYFSVTEPQNYIGVMGYGRLQNPKLGDLSLDGFGAAAIANLDVKPFSWLRTEVSGSYAEDVARREGKNAIFNIGLGRVGSELVLADNKDFYFSFGPVLGVNSIRSEDAAGFEPKRLDAYLVGGKARVSLKDLGLEAYVSGLQSVEGKHKTSEGLEFDYNVRELRAGVKKNLGKGVSVGFEGADIFQETKDVTRFWIRNGSGYIELKDFVKGLSAWGIVTGRDIDAPGKQRANELECRLRLLADLGYGLHAGIGGSYSFSKVQGIEGSNNYSLDALIALGF